MKLLLGRFLALSIMLAAVPCDASEKIVDGRGIGDLIIGQPPPAHTRDRLLSRQWQSDDTGNRYELLRVRMKGVPVDAEVYDGKIWRIWVGQRGLSTRDGLQVGDSVQKLIGTNRSLRHEIGPGPSLVLIPENLCGISYVTDAELPPNIAREASTELPTEYARNTLIRRILIVGCDE